MIQAEFQKKRPWSGICLFCGIFLIGLFVFILHKDDTATVGDLLVGFILGTFFCIVGSISLFFNRRAYLCIDKTGNIKGKYHFFGKMDCEASHVEYASVGYNALTLHLKNGKIHTIMGIENAVELVHAIRQNISFEVREKPDPPIQKLSDLKTNRRKYLIYCCVGTALMFVNIFITVFLTGQREMSAFSKTDWILFAIMGTIEIGTVIATFYFAQKAGKAASHMESLQYTIRRIIVETKPLLPGLAMGVYTDDNYSGRITLFGYPKESTVYYTVEKFDLNHKLLQTFTSELFKDPEALPEGLSDLIAISQKFITPS